MSIRLRLFSLMPRQTHRLWNSLNKRIFFLQKKNFFAKSFSRGSSGRFEALGKTKLSATDPGKYENHRALSNCIKWNVTQFSSAKINILIKWSFFLVKQTKEEKKFEWEGFMNLLWFCNCPKSWPALDDRNLLFCRKIMKVGKIRECKKIKAEESKKFD